MAALFLVNVGCGATPTPGWINFDNSWSVRIARTPGAAWALRSLGLLSPPRAQFVETISEFNGIRWADATRRIPLSSASTRAVYSSHMLEHLDHEGVVALLREVRRILAPGGILRFAVPDSALLLRAYAATGDADAFMTGTFLGGIAPRSVGARLRAAALGPRHHLWMYDGPSLAALLTRQGFVDVVVQPPGKTMIPEPGALDLSERADESVYVEGRRD